MVTNEPNATLLAVRDLIVEKSLASDASDVTWGSLPLKDLIQPSIELAKAGFTVTEKQAQSLNNKRDEFIKVNKVQSDK